ncbi:hypothetical protein IP88_07650 [alpha proteobacterium AAP81b]|nr:hypothetical protein IP88_07650 [alpha proteobacterium AAP81b]
MGVTLATGDRLNKLLRPGPDAATVADASLKALRKQARLTVLSARFTAVITSTQTRIGLFTGSKTLIVPGNVRYELDWNKVAADDVVWNPATRTLNVAVPAPELAGPEVDLAAARELRAGSLLFALTDAESQLDDANRREVNDALLNQARAPALTEMARQAEIEAIQRTFLLPLTAAGFADARVVVQIKA